MTEQIYDIYEHCGAGGSGMYICCNTDIYI